MNIITNVFTNMFINNVFTARKRKINKHICNIKTCTGSINSNFNNVEYIKCKKYEKNKMIELNNRRNLYMNEITQFCNNCTETNNKHKYCLHCTHLDIFHDKKYRMIIENNYIECIICIQKYKQKLLFKHKLLILWCLKQYYSPLYETKDIMNIIFKNNIV
jgi:hypothetical protein